MDHKEVKAWLRAKAHRDELTQAQERDREALEVTREDAEFLRTFGDGLEASTGASANANRFRGIAAAIDAILATEGDRG
jgi:hypothetical protein